MFVENADLAALAVLVLVLAATPRTFAFGVPLSLFVNTIMVAKLGLLRLQRASTVWL